MLLTMRYLFLIVFTPTHTAMELARTSVRWVLGSI